MPAISSVCNAAQARDILRRLPGILAGRAPDPWGVARAIGMRVGFVLLSKIQQAFIAKARGGTGEDGIRWAALKPATLDRRRQGRGGKKGRGGRKGKKKPAGQAEILRDTGRLFNSLTPGVPGAKKADQVAEAPPGKVVVGTVVPYARAHHRGVKRRGLPSRPLWPLNGTVPAGWSKAMLEALKRGIMQAVVQILQRGGRP